MSFFRKKSLFIILIGIIIMVVLLGYSLSNRNVTTGEKFIMDSVGWAQNVIHQPVSYVIDFFGNLNDIKYTYDENKLLREKLAEYKTLIYEVQELEEENKELRKLLDMTESARDYEPILANVIARSPERWLEQLTINRGSQHGIKKNMAVITADGMIGKVKSVSHFTSTVQLISGFDQFNRVSAIISKKDSENIFGLIEGYDQENEMLLFRIIEHTGSKIKQDDLVVSSNKGGLYPSGLAIGTIKEVIPDQYGLTKTAYVEPAANLHHIDQVIVVDRSLDVYDEERAVDEEESEEETEEEEEE